ncbi:MAG: thiamine phosphate synthase [Phycisphaeraceae bacterium]|nr:thiamine phosphate synthase [Phycisphaeraceae bacterium]
MDPRLRIIDANLNRAREALRVMEDIARFALDHEPLCRELKGIRHDLHHATSATLGDNPTEVALYASRDTAGDVGTSVSTAGEGRRDDLRHVAIAAGKRLTEALRSIEECAKLAPGAGAEFERLRYRSYEADRRLVLAFGCGRARQWRLCVLITESLCTHHSWRDVAEMSIRSGADCIQLREKALPDRKLLDRAAWLVDRAAALSSSTTGEARTAIIINDRPDIALLARADGVHLGQDDLPLADARRLAPGLIIGVSTENLAQARAASEGGADYCALGPMFPTTTKDKPRLAGPAYLGEFLASPLATSRPHLCIGGIGPGNAGTLAAIGCRGVAVSSAVCAAADPAGACRAILASLSADTAAEPARGPRVTTA